jgi:hypothetical protein
MQRSSKQGLLCSPATNPASGTGAHAGVTRHRFQAQIDMPRKSGATPFGSMTSAPWQVLQ